MRNFLYLLLVSLMLGVLFFPGATQCQAAAPIFTTNKTDVLTSGWVSPKFPVRDQQYYRLSYMSKSGGPFYWYILFYDSNGQLLEGDHYATTDPSTEWTRQEYCFQTKFPAVTATVGFRPTDYPAVNGGGPCNVEDLSITPVSHRAVRAWADALYATMPPIVYTPPADACTLLPQAIRKLKKGGPFRIVLFGTAFPMT